MNGYTIATGGRFLRKSLLTCLTYVTKSSLLSFRQFAWVELSSVQNIRVESARSSATAGGQRTHALSLKSHRLLQNCTNKMPFTELAILEWPSASFKVIDIGANR